MKEAPASIRPEAQSARFYRLEERAGALAGLPPNGIGD